MSAPLLLPDDYSRIQIVKSFEELAAAPFANGVNALCWPRSLVGDFAEVVARIEPQEGVLPLDESLLRALPLSAEGERAVEAILTDFHRLQQLERDPAINLINGYPRDEEPGPIKTDVFSYHADSAPVEADTWLCTYFGAPSEGLRNEEALRKIDLPSTREELLQLWGGADDEDFREFLRECCYDLHYAAAPRAEAFSFGVAHLWRIAIDWPGCAVPPCIHRAPQTQPGDPLRLMLIC